MKFKSLLFIVFLSSNILFSQEYIKIGDSLITKEKFSANLENIKNENFSSQVFHNVYERELRNDSVINNMRILIFKSNKLFSTSLYKFLHEPFPTFKIQGIDKAIYSKFNFRNKYTLVCLWSKYGLPSNQNIRKLNLLSSYEKYNVVGIYKGVEFDKNKSKKIRFPLLLDKDKWFNESFGGLNTPNYLIMDGDGIIKYIFPSQRFPDSKTKYFPINNKHKEILDILSGNQK